MPLAESAAVSALAPGSEDRVALRAHAIDEERARIAHRGRAGVGCQRHRLAFAQQRHDALRGGSLVVLVQRDHAGGDAEVREQALGDARVFRGHDVAGGQRVARARGDVAEVPDGRGHHI